MRMTFLLAMFALSFNSMAQELKEAALRIGTYNIRNYDYDSREKVSTNNTELEKIIRSANPDLLAVQEIVKYDRFERFISKNLSEYQTIIARCGGRGKQRPGMLYRSSSVELLWSKEDSRLNDRKNCEDGVRPALIAKFRHKKTGMEFIALSVHLKAGSQDENIEQRFKQLAILSQILKEIRQEHGTNVALMGDFNSTEYNRYGNNYQRFKTFVEVNKLIDFSQELKCTAYWWGGRDNGTEESSLLDHVMFSQEMARQFRQKTTSLYSHCQKVSCDDVSAETLGLSYKQVSDHCPVVASVQK